VLVVERTRKIVHFVPRDTAFCGILEIEAQTLCVIDRLFQLVPNLALLALW
jgi:hypothetical protein